MLRFLRLFPQFRRVEADVSRFENEAMMAENELESLRVANEDLIAEKRALEQRLDLAFADKDQVWAAMREALSGERLAYQMQINHAVQRSGGGIPYPDAHALPPNAINVQAGGPAGRSGRQLPSEARAQVTGQTLQEMLRMRANG